MEKKFITLESPEVDRWFEDAKYMTLESLPSFLNQLMSEYSHDMNTVVYAMVAGALGSIAAMDKTEEGGLTAAQKNQFIGQFIRQYLLIEGPAKLTSWFGMLNVDNEKVFNGVPRDVAEILKDKAKELLNGDLDGVEERSIEHLKKMADGHIPFGYSIEG